MDIPIYVQYVYVYYVVFAPLSVQAWSLGTAFSGMEATTFALRQLDEDCSYRHCFAIDINKHCRNFIRQNCTVEETYEDIADVKVSDLAAVDIYVAGFPCQPWSMAGQRKGEEDEHGRGTMFSYCETYIESKRPGAFVLENVSSLATTKKFKPYFDKMMTSLRGIGDGAYSVHYAIMNTRDHGVPQNRKRLFVVGIKISEKAPAAGPFKFPKKLKVSLSLRECLDMGVRGPDDWMDSLSATGTRNVTKALHAMVQRGASLRNDVIMVDICAGPSRPANWVKNVCPCITRARGGAGGYLILNLGRTTSAKELLRLQGLPENVARQNISDRQLGLMVGLSTYTYASEQNNNQLPPP